MAGRSFAKAPQHHQDFFSSRTANSFPLIAYLERVIGIFTDCFTARSHKYPHGYEEVALLASETAFTVNEVEALYELYKKLSSSVIDDGLIHKEELQLALFGCATKENLFADRIFNLFDKNHNGVIDFGEFVRGLSIFHPDASQDDKIDFAFRLYDLRQTGYIDREEVKQMIVAFFNESNMELTDDVLEPILDKTFLDANFCRAGKVDKEEWREFVTQYPSLLKNMTIPYLMNIPTAFQSFVLNTEVDDLAN